MTKSPAFQFYPADWLADERLAVASLEVEGAYIRLLAYAWREGSIPADVATASALCKNAPQEVIEAALRFFIPDARDPSRLVNKRMEDEREKQKAYRDKQKARIEKRWGSPCNTTVIPRYDSGNTTVIPDGYSSSSSSSSTTETDKSVRATSKKPTLADVRAYCQLRSNRVDPEKWMAHYEANGWKVGRNAMRDWQAAVRTWENNGIGGEKTTPAGRDIAKAKPPTDDDACEHCGAVVGASRRPPPGGIVDAATGNPVETPCPACGGALRGVG